MPGMGAVVFTGKLRYARLPARSIMTPRRSGTCSVVSSCRALNSASVSGPVEAGEVDSFLLSLPLQAVNSAINSHAFAVRRCMAGAYMLVVPW